MKKLTIFFLILAFNSCYLFKENKIQFTIENKSDFIIKNVSFTTSEKLTVMKFKKIEPNESVDGFLSMKNNKTDGSYILEFTRSNGIKESRSFGYYSNGKAPYGESVVLEIKDKIVNSKFGITKQNGTK
jgi:hypothetical protein